MIKYKTLKCVECEYNDYNISCGKCYNCHDGSNFKERYYWVNKDDDSESGEIDND